MLDEIAGRLAALDVPRSALEAVLLFNFIVAFVTFWAMIVLLVLLPFNTKPGSIRGWLSMNPLNVVFFGALLTPRGKALRKWLICSVLLYAGAMSSVVFLTTTMQFPHAPT